MLRQVTRLPIRAINTLRSLLRLHAAARWASNHARLCRRLKALSLLASSLMVLLFVGLVNETPFLRALSAEPMVAVMFFFWLRILERPGDGLYRPATSLFMCSTAVAGFIIYAGVGYHQGGQYGLILGTLASLFVTVDGGTLLRHAMRQPRAAGIFMAGAAAWSAYCTLGAYVWLNMYNATAQAVQWLLGLFVADTTAYQVPFPVSGRGHAPSIAIASPHFSIAIFWSCTGVEGILLFVVLLSLAILADWRRLGHLPFRLIDLYLIAVVYAFSINALRLTVYFLLGYWAWGHTSPLAQAVRGVPLAFFHTWVGWTVDLFAFWLFMTCLYKVLSRFVRRVGTAGAG